MGPRGLEQRPPEGKWLPGAVGNQLHHPAGRTAGQASVTVLRRNASVSQPEMDPLAPVEEETHTGRPEVADGDPLKRARVIADPATGLRRSLSPAILIPSRLDDTDIVPAWSVLSQIQQLLEHPPLVLGRARRHQESGLPQ